MLFISPPVAAREIAGVGVPASHTVDGHVLRLNGAGLRTATFLNVKVYVAALYLTEPSRDAEAVAKARPVWIDFTFVREVDEKRGDDAWRFQFKESVPDPYPGMERDVETLAGFLGPIRKYGVQSFYLKGDDTAVFENGAIKGYVPGAAFQKAFMSIWTGPKPPTESLKKALLGDVFK